MHKKETTSYTLKQYEEQVKAYDAYIDTLHETTSWDTADKISLLNVSMLMPNSPSNTWEYSEWLQVGKDVLQLMRGCIDPDSLRFENGDTIRVKITKRTKDLGERLCNVFNETQPDNTKIVRSYLTLWWD